ncbi:hypothetical protein V8B97DRAFT_1877860 [Scleroderma yunnanense]
MSPQTWRVRGLTRPSVSRSTSTHHIFPGLSDKKFKLLLCQRISESPLNRSNYIHKIPNESLSIFSQYQDVQWKCVDLAKVLKSAHTTELDLKQTHVIDEKVKLSFHISKPIGSIRTAADHITAFTMLIKAIAFIFPQ